jgi:hypothetical protein
MSRESFIPDADICETDTRQSFVPAADINETVSTTPPANPTVTHHLASLGVGS